MIIETLRAKENDHCIICGQKNISGLKIKYELLPDGKIHGLWVPEGSHEGLKGIIHGGILSAIADEAMSKSVISANIEALTVKLEIRFHNYVTIGDILIIEGWIVKKHKRKIMTEAVITKETGKKVLHGNAVFLSL